MNKLNRADVHAACRLRDEQELWINFIFTPDDQLLLIPARERSCRQGSIWRTNVKRLNDLGRTSLDGILVKENSAGQRGHRRTIVNAQNRVLREGEVEQQSTAMTILRNVRDTKLA